MRMKKLSARKRKWIERTVFNDRSYKVWLYNRFFTYLIAVLAQLVGYALLLVLFVYRSEIATALQLIIGILAVLFVMRIVNQNYAPSLKISWVIVILIAPVFGVPVYLIHGEGRPTKKMRRRYAESVLQNQKAERQFYGDEPQGDKTERGQVSAYLSEVAGYPAYGGDIDYYDSGESAFKQLLSELKKAEKYIFLQYFIIAPGRMWTDILHVILEKAIQGVQIRIIYDDFGCMMSLPPKYERYLESLHENIKCMTFNDVVPFFSVRMNNRDHRKIAVIDGKVAFTGGYNLADEYIGEKRRFGYWKDSGVKITGNAVLPFIRMFLNTWNAFRADKEDIKAYLVPKKKEGGDSFIQPYDDSPLDNLQTGEAVYLDMINRAQSYLYIFTPYLILDDMMRIALCQASLRGVDVRVVTPAIPDKKTTYRLTRANYDVLLKAGVRIYEYTPGFIHAKSMISDDKCAVVGTINLDYRSLYHHFENAVYFNGTDALKALKADCENTFAVSYERTKENYKRTRFGRAVDAFLRMFETLL